MRIVGVVVELGVPEESGWVELIVATDNGLDVGFDTEEGVGLPVKFTGAVDVGRAEVLGLANLLVGLGSSETLDFDLPNPKSLAKNPGFLTFGYTSNGLRITGTVKKNTYRRGWDRPVIQQRRRRWRTLRPYTRGIGAER